MNLQVNARMIPSLLGRSRWRGPGTDMRSHITDCFLTVILLFTVLTAQARDTRLFWGDTHLHTNNSPDASLNGNFRIGPEDAFRFARGEAVTGHSGATAKLERPLDFLVVSDHAEYLGLLPRVRAGDSLIMKNEVTRRWHDLIESGDEEQTWKAMFEVLDDIVSNKPGFDDTQIRHSTWGRFVQVADSYNEPGKFTTFIGYEWTSMPQGNNLHRVVIYRDGAEKAGKMLPFSAFDGDVPEQLWAFLEQYEAATGGKVFAIPHNGNMSNGRMFEETDFTGNPIDRNYATTRSRWEPLYEVTQIKGDGEAHPQLSPDDPFADFENWDRGNIAVTTAKQPGMFRYEYARPALKTGLELEQRVGVNPYRFGLIGSSDAHTGFAAVAEQNYWGKFSVYEPGLHRLTHQTATKGKNGQAFDSWAYELVASGYAGVWATENTRAALFDAMQRREVYATTGPRIRLQFFAGWDFLPTDADADDFAATGYDQGVPMGGVLGAAPATAGPTFIINALKDPQGVPLQRVQVVKGWLDETGAAREQIYDVALVESGTVGFHSYWQDPAFDPRAHAFYYLRVLEVPKPRWTTLEAQRLNVAPPQRVPAEIQDRAYSSPVWYSP